MSAFHRVVSGNPTRRVELIAAGIFVLIWFAIDVVQFVDWVVTKWNAPRPVACEPIVRSTLCFTPAMGSYYCGSHDCSIPLTQNNAR